MNDHQIASKSRKLNNSTKSLIVIFIFSGITIIIWQFPEGYYILYPFTILGTWFHEMGHGISAIITGGNFILLEIFPNGSGLARHTQGDFLGVFGQAFVAASGPIGPTIAGSIFLISSKRENLSRLLLLLFSLVLLISMILWIRSIFAIGILSLFCIATFFLSIVKNPRIPVITLQFFGVQAFASVYQSFDYLFTEGAVIDGKQYLSDTAYIAQVLYLPYWFWGGTIILFSIIMIYISLKILLKEPKSDFNALKYK